MTAALRYTEVAMEAESGSHWARAELKKYAQNKSDETMEALRVWSSGVNLAGWELPDGRIIEDEEMMLHRINDTRGNQDWKKMLVEETELPD